MTCFMTICSFVIYRECGWRDSDNIPVCLDPCVVCLERKCTVAVEGTFPLSLQTSIHDLISASKCYR